MAPHQCQVRKPSLWILVLLKKSVVFCSANLYCRAYNGSIIKGRNLYFCAFIKKIRLYVIFS